MTRESKESRMRRRSKRSRRKLGLALYDVRVSKGITQTQMARDLNVAPSTLCLWEHGDCMPEKKYWDDIFKNLGVSVAEYKPDIAMDTHPVTDFGPSDFAKKLHAIRLKRKLTPYAINKLVLNSSSDAARAWERGEKIPTDESMALLLEKLGDDEDTRELYTLWEKEVEQWCKKRVLGWKTTKYRVNKREHCKRKIINVSLQRCLDRNISSEGFVGDACLFLRTVARIVVGEMVNKKENRDRKELPSWNADLGSYTYIRQGKTYSVQRIWDFNWSSYLFNRYIAACVVMNPEDEDKEFFGDTSSRSIIYKTDLDPVEETQVVSNKTEAMNERRPKVRRFYAQLLKAYRDETGMTQKKLGKIIGVSEDRISSWECARATPTPKYIQRIEQEFGVDTDKDLKTCIHDMKVHIKDWHKEEAENGME